MQVLYCTVYCCILHALVSCTDLLMICKPYAYQTSSLIDLFLLFSFHFPFSFISSRWSGRGFHKLNSYVYVYFRLLYLCSIFSNMYINILVINTRYSDTLAFLMKVVNICHHHDCKSPPSLELEEMFWRG